MDVVLRTEDLPVAERVAYWRDATSRMLAPVETRSDQAVDFRAYARLLDFGAVQVSQVMCSSYVARRTPYLIRQSDPELLQLSLNLHGRSGVTQARRDVTLDACDMVLYDTSRPFEGNGVPSHDGAAWAGSLKMRTTAAGHPLPPVCACSDKRFALSAKTIVRKPVHCVSR
jgi:hypothetical protein